MISVVVIDKKELVWAGDEGIRDKTVLLWNYVLVSGKAFFIFPFFFCFFCVNFKWVILYISVDMYV